MAQPHPENVPGDFYVEDGCCLSCGVPEEMAPDIFGWQTEPGHCFVKCQPGNSEQLDRTLRAMWSSETECIRYRGTDSAIIQRIAAFGNGDCCDVPTDEANILIRDQVRFHSAIPGDSPLAIAGRFRSWLTLVEGHLGPHYQVRSPRRWNRNTVIFSWEGGLTRFPAYHRVRLYRADDGMLSATLRSGRTLAAHGLALTVHDWLNDIDRASEIRWFSLDERMRNAPGCHMPI